MQNSSAQSSAQPERAPSKRKRNFAILLVLLVLIAAGCLAWYFLYARYYETTDDAYVNANLVTLTPQIAGTVTQVAVDEGDYVAKGQPLVLLDPSDTQIALQQAEANLASTVRQVRGLYSTADNYRAQVAAKKWLCKPRRTTSPVDRRSLLPGRLRQKICRTIAMPWPRKRFSGGATGVEYQPGDG
jgi:membrane fusion protein (multidrug efflux system)